MSNERLIARGRLEELKKDNYALHVEIRTLADDIRRKIPTPQENSTDISIVKGREAQILLARLVKIQKEFIQTQNLIEAIIEEYDFKED